MISGSVRNRIAVNAVNNPTTTKKENRKYDNSTLNKNQLAGRLRGAVFFSAAKQLKDRRA